MQKNCTIKNRWNFFSSDLAASQIKRSISEFENNEEKVINIEEILNPCNTKVAHSGRQIQIAMKCQKEITSFSFF
jgi:hypothetical protein